MQIKMDFGSINGINYENQNEIRMKVEWKFQCKNAANSNANASVLDFSSRRWLNQLAIPPLYPSHDKI